MSPVYGRNGWEISEKEKRNPSPMEGDKQEKYRRRSAGNEKEKLRRGKTVNAGNVGRGGRLGVGWGSAPKGKQTYPNSFKPTFTHLLLARGGVCRMKKLPSQDSETLLIEKRDEGGQRGSSAEGTDLQPPWLPVSLLLKCRAGHLTRGNNGAATRERRTEEKGPFKECGHRKGAKTAAGNV